MFESLMYQHPVLRYLNTPGHNLVRIIQGIQRNYMWRVISSQIVGYGTCPSTTPLVKFRWSRRCCISMDKTCSMPKIPRLQWCQPVKLCIARRYQREEQCETKYVVWDVWWVWLWLVSPEYRGCFMIHGSEEPILLWALSLAWDASKCSRL